ncbi:uncharacterized protein LOC133174128 [Saccostrea echinata]|uniref:uncharacterized protein LOC133174128 n=1 Tax=Saccostrea echinata TaxID=191078 RepID=UPI002A7EC564|nr:uncharacterized protein LOC133174128 [Saccostrea echinata]
MDVFILRLSILMLMTWTSLGLPDKDNTKPGHVVLHPPSNLSTFYIGDGDVYFYWNPPQNYHTHQPGNLTKAQVYKIRNKDHIHFSDSGSWIEKGSETERDQDWIFRLFSISGISAKSHQRELKNSQKIQKTNQSIEDHIDQANLTSEQVEKYKQYLKSKNISNIPDWFQKTTVPKEHAGILWYTIFWQEMDNGTEIGEAQNYSVKPDKLAYHIKGLKAETDYRINVQVMYYSFTSLKSEDLFIKTNRNYSLIHEEDYRNIYDYCRCDTMGTKNGTSKCKIHQYGQLTLSLCECREGYSGMYCHLCRPGYYRLGPNMPCFKCPCVPEKSDGHCHFEEGYLFCDTCKEGYGGNLCQACAAGYYRPQMSTKCTKCNCHGNALFCQDLTGECIACMNHTAGFNCHRCEHGYVGNAQSYRHPKCVNPAEVKMQEKKSSVSSGVIAGICVAIIIFIGVITGIVIYKRCWIYPVARPFWTVELKDDHEGINFSSVPEDELVAITAREEEEFYRGQGVKTSKSRSQPYSQLREDI